MIGDARGYELTGNVTQKAIATNFFNILTTTRDWATGGSNSGEMVRGAPSPNLLTVLYNGLGCTVQFAYMNRTYHIYIIALCTAKFEALFLHPSILFVRSGAPPTGSAMD